MTIRRLPLLYCDTRTEACALGDEPLQGDSSETGTSLALGNGFRSLPGGRHQCPACTGYLRAARSVGGPS